MFLDRIIKRKPNKDLVEFYQRFPEPQFVVRAMETTRSEGHLWWKSRLYSFRQKADIGYIEIDQGWAKSSDEFRKSYIRSLRSGN